MRKRERERVRKKERESCMYKQTCTHKQTVLACSVSQSVSMGEYYINKSLAKFLAKIPMRATAVTTLSRSLPKSGASVRSFTQVGCSLTCKH